jgi:hypothetical protein
VIELLSPGRGFTEHAPPADQLASGTVGQEQLQRLLEQPDRRYEEWYANRHENHRDAQHQRNDKEDGRQ